MKFWLSLNISSLIRKTLEEGFLPSFHTEPNLEFAEFNRKSTEDHKEFISDQIQSLLRSKAISISNSARIRVNPLSVAEGKKLRLILDLSDLNKCLERRHVKFEDLSKVRDLLPRHGFMTCFDLRSGYHHVLVHPNFRKYLGFKWGSLIYSFNVLPFGLSPAPFIFTKLFKPLLARWRSQGIGVAVYLDDGIIWARTESQCRAFSAIVKRDLQDAGFFLAEEKCSWQPCQRMTWLGHLIDLNEMSLDITEERKAKARMIITALLKVRSPSLRGRMKLLGTLASMHLIMPPEISKKNRSVVTEVACKVCSGHRLGFRWPLTAEERKEIIGGLGFLKNCKTSLHNFHKDFCDYFVISTDASNSGVGAVFHTSTSSNRIATATLPCFLREESSTARELYGILQAVKSFSHLISNEKVQIQTDSQAAQSVFYKGSTKKVLQQLASQIWEIVEQLRVDMQVFWIPRELNDEADDASRIIDLNGWSILDSIFDKLNERWGPFEVDMFADANNKKYGSARAPRPSTSSASQPRNSGVNIIAEMDETSPDTAQRPENCSRQAHSHLNSTTSIQSIAQSDYFSHDADLRMVHLLFGL
ncbi:reverse transcriptase, partial [Ostertagia ostertagi]